VLRASKNKLVKLNHNLIYKRFVFVVINSVNLSVAGAYPFGAYGTPMQFPSPHIHRVSLSGSFGDADDFGADFGFGEDFSFGLGIDFGAGFGDFGDFGDFNNVDDLVDVFYHEADDFMDDTADEQCLGGSNRRQRRANRLFRIESVKTSMWYLRFTRESIREQTHMLSSSDRYGAFRHFFSMPLSKVATLSHILISRGYVKFPRTRFRQLEYDARTELLVMSSLYILGRGAAYRSCQDMCNISTSDVRKFFHVFLKAIVDMRDEQIYMPRNRNELERISCFYDHVGLPGCCGSMDVVHVKWSNCPSGDFNRAKGKESYPSLGFQCITDMN
jgi:hypothetical protein